MSEHILSLQESHFHTARALRDGTRSRRLDMCVVLPPCTHEYALTLALAHVHRHTLHLVDALDRHHLLDLAGIDEEHISEEDGLYTRVYMTCKHVYAYMYTYNKDDFRQPFPM